MFQTISGKTEVCARNGFVCSSFNIRWPYVAGFELLLDYFRPPSLPCQLAGNQHPCHRYVEEIKVQQWKFGAGGGMCRALTVGAPLLTQLARCMSFLNILVRHACPNNSPSRCTSRAAERLWTQILTQLTYPQVSWRFERFGHASAAAASARHVAAC